MESIALKANLVQIDGLQHPAVVALGVYDQESGYIDVDTLYRAFVPQLGAEKIPVSIPKMGTIKMGREEFDLLVRYIKEA